jgi:tetratricopeptide (TPR) repeat protein
MIDPPTPDKKLGKIVTFYSYKGGTGRSMALANVAWLLAANGYSVLAIDWDLEAPGLHRYLLPFLRDPELAETRGVIDLLWDYVNLVLTPQDAWPSSVKTPTDLADVRPYLASLENPFADAGGCFHFLCAGEQVPAYAGRFRDFDWRALYERQGGGALIDKLAERLRNQYEFVLIDSRTGVADTSGICTVHLPDEVVLCFTYNRQSVKGVAAVAQSIHAQRTPAPPIWPVPMRVEKGIEGLNEARDFAREELDRFLPANWRADDRAGYWESCEIAYYPDYAFGETLAVFRDRRQLRSSLVADMRWLASRLVPVDREPKIPSLDAERRDGILRRYRLRDPRKAELAELLAQPLSSTTTARLLSLAREALQSAEPDQDYHAALGQALTTAVKLSGLDQPEAAHSLALNAKELYQRLARERPSDFGPSLAASLNNLGLALQRLGERESGTKRLAEAVAAYRAALEERTRERVPLEWAKTQMNLGNALKSLGEREAGMQRLEEAVAAYRAALEENTRERVPLEWAKTQMNLGTALRALGEREGGMQRLEEAVAAYRAALEERTRERVPLEWATTQMNLGNALATLGERKGSMQRLEEAVAAYRAALEEMTRERVPLDWAATQYNLALAYRAQFDKDHQPYHLDDALEATDGGLEEFRKANAAYYTDKAERQREEILALKGKP